MSKELIRSLRDLRLELERLLDTGWTPPPEMREDAEALFGDLGEVLNMLDSRDLESLQWD